MKSELSDKYIQVLEIDVQDVFSVQQIEYYKILGKNLISKFWDRIIKWEENDIDNQRMLLFGFIFKERGLSIVFKDKLD